MEARDKSQARISNLGRERNEPEQEDFCDPEKAMSNRVEPADISLPDRSTELRAVDIS